MVSQVPKSEAPGAPIFSGCFHFSRHLGHPPTHEITLDDKKTRKVPLSQLTFHARDVYPELLRSTLLIRLVAAYEALLTDTLREVASYSSEFLNSDEHLDLSQRHLLHLAKSESLMNYILNKTMRSLSSGGFKEIAKFYKRRSIEVIPAGATLSDLEEIHDRRHLYVHRGGTPDEQYCKKYPSSGAIPEVVIRVDEPYLLNTIRLLSASAKYVQKQIDSKFPASSWAYANGAQNLSNVLEHVNLFTGRVLSSDPFDLSIVLPDGTTKLGDLVIWVGRNDSKFKLLIGGNATETTLYSKYMHLVEARGIIAQVVSEKILR